MGQSKRRQSIGEIAALLTPLFMGMAPVFGTLVLRSGMDAFTLAAIRTCMAALLLWIVYGLFFRQYTFIFPAGLLGTLVVGATNGLGSLLYYNGLLLLDDASLAQLLNMFYVIFAMLLTRFYGHHISKLSILRAFLALVAVYLLTVAGVSTRTQIHWIGVGLMLGSAFTYALHIVLSQRVMYEMPAPTMSLYALTWMGLTALLVRLVFGFAYTLPWSPQLSHAWWYLLGLMAVTALSRVTLFAGVRELGGLQTILLNMAELGVTLLVAFFWLGDRMTPWQWVGVVVLLASVVLSHWDTQVRDDVYRQIPVPTPLGGFPIFYDEPISPDRFSTISRMFRRKPKSDLLEGIPPELYTSSAKGKGE